MTHGDGDEETIKNIQPHYRSKTSLVITMQPCSPNMDYPDAPVFSTEPNISPPKLDNESTSRSSGTKRQFLSKDSSAASSFQTSFDNTDDESVANRESLEELSNESLSDSLLQSTFRDKIKRAKDKTRKKQNRFSKIISGVSHKSKSELFQKLFKDMSGDERRIVDYSCALSRDILIHGRMYMSQNWLCFHANIFGWETLVTIQWHEITAITKEKTAKVIPNAIQVLTNTDKYFFTTFVTRENSYTAMFRIWQNALLNHPMSPNDLKVLCKKYRQKKSSFGVTLDGIPVNDEHDETGDELLEEDDLTSLSASQENLSCRADELMDSTNLDTDRSALTDPPQSSVNGEKKFVKTEDFTHNGLDDSPNTDLDAKHERYDKRNRGHVPLTLTKDEHHQLRNRAKHSNHRPTSPFTIANDLFRKNRINKTPRQTKHSSYNLTIPDRNGEPTTDIDSDESAVHELEDDEDVICSCTEHPGKVYLDEEFNFDVDTLYDHLFSQESDMMKRVFEQRTFLNWKYTPFEKQGDEYYTQTLTYTLPLNYSIGPKESYTITKQMMPLTNKQGSCIIVDVENTSQGVPYSDSFVVLIRYCMTKLVGHRSRLKVHGELKYRKRVFGLVKNMITKTSDEACRDYFNYLVTVLKSESELVPQNVKLPKREKREKRKTLEVAATSTTKTAVPIACQQKGSISVQPSGFMSTPQFSTTTVAGFLIAMLLLFSMNLYLMNRLKTLESSVFIQRNSWLLEEMPTSDEGWKKLLDYQKGLHDVELLKLKEVIGNTASLIKQIETSISSLYDELERSTNNNGLDNNNSQGGEL